MHNTPGCYKGAPYMLNLAWGPLHQKYMTSKGVPNRQYPTSDKQNAQLSININIPCMHMCMQGGRC